MITLYNLPGCPDCIRIIKELKALGLEYRTIDVPGPKSLRHEVYKVSGQHLVPVLIDDGNVLVDEDHRIEKYLRRIYG